MSKNNEKKIMKQKTAMLTLLVLLVASLFFAYFPQQVKAITYTQTWIFSGPYNKYTSDVTALLSGAVTVTAHYANEILPVATFSVHSSSYSWETNSTILYFSFDYNSSHREYWLTSNDQTHGNHPLFLFFSSRADTSDYVINFMDQVGMLKTYRYIEAQIYWAGSYLTIDKRLVDSQNSVVLGLVTGSRYRLVITDGLTPNVYGDLVATAVTGVQLTLRGVDFPKETLQLYQYIHTSAIRDFLTPTGAITISYEDLTSNTNSVNVTITNATSGAVEYTHIFSSDNLFSYTWTSVDNATSYQVTITIDHATYGTFYYEHYLLGEYTKAHDPFSLDFLGAGFPVTTAVLIPALIIIFAAGCFSELTSEAAAVIVVLTAIILTALGWITIPQGSIIAALSLAVMAGVVGARKRMQNY